MDFAKLSTDDLQQMQSQIEREIKRRRTQDKKEVLKKIRAMAAAGGYSLEELMQGMEGVEAPKATRVVPPKYRHPKDPAATWTGRGKQPRWVVEALANGKSLDDLLIR